MNDTTDTELDTETEAPKRYQCRHIFTDGRRCGSPALRNQPLCYYHHTNRKPVKAPRARKNRSSTFDLPLPEDQSAIQHSIGQVLQRIASNDIDPRRAGLLLYGLQIASLNLPKPPAANRNTKTGSSQPQTQSEIVEEITHDPELGPLAPEAEYTRGQRRKSPVEILMEKMLKDPEPKPKTNPATPTQPPKSITLPVIQATAAKTNNTKPKKESVPIGVKPSLFFYRLRTFLPVPSLLQQPQGICCRSNPCGRAVFRTESKRRVP